MSGILLIPLGAGTPPPPLHFKRAAFSCGVPRSRGASFAQQARKRPQRGCRLGPPFQSRTVIGGKGVRGRTKFQGNQRFQPIFQIEPALCSEETRAIASAAETGCSATGQTLTRIGRLTLMPIKRFDVKRLFEAIRARHGNDLRLPAGDKTPAAASNDRAAHE